MTKSVVILGGGLAGLASAVFLSKEGFNVSLYETSTKWGGRTYSYFDAEKNIYIDNSQHILAGWYENTFDYLKIIGMYEKLKLKNNLNLVYCDKNKQTYNLKCGGLPGVYSLLSGIFMFRGFNLKDKIKFLKVKNLLNRRKYTEEYLNKINVAELLVKIKQTNNLKKYFWHPFIYAAFNTVPENVSADLFVKLIKKGTEFKKNMSIILTDENLNDLFVNSAVNYLNGKSVSLNLGLGGEKINIIENSVNSIVLGNGKSISADYYISAVPYYSFDYLFEKDVNLKYFSDICNLKSSAIISVHLFFNKEIDVCNEMIGLVDTVVQWVFEKNKKHLCLVISSADFIENNLTKKNNDEIIKICVDDLKSCLKNFDENNIADCKVIKEKRATFLPETGSEKYRLKQKSNYDNLFIAGDWTDTGYPATIEGAIKSARICADLIIKN
jgi:squalene-associated FAD-dependent desaturase